jgi:cytochrome c oxidase assembly protein subunit 15
MSALSSRLGRIRGLALTVAALSLVVVAVSAYLRLDAAGLGCADWPACYGAVLSGHPPAQVYGFARLLHRIAASAALVLAGILVWQCLRPSPLAAARPAVLLLALMLLLSLLGIFSADPRRALVGFLNIVGGLGLVSFSWRVALSASVDVSIRSPAKVSRFFRLGVLALTLTVLLGAWIGATHSALACLSLPTCEGSVRALAEGWTIFNPSLFLGAASGPESPGGVLLHLLHRGLALTTVLLLGASLLGALRRGAGAPAGWALFLLALVAGLGVAGIASGLNLWLVVGHGLAAALLLAALATPLRMRVA